MRPSSLLVPFLIFSILMSEVQATRLNKGLLSVGHHKIHTGLFFSQEGSTVIKESINVAVAEKAIHAVGEKAVHNKDGHFSGSNRKLMNKATSNPTTSTTTTTATTTTATTITATTISKEQKNEGTKEESFSVNLSTPVSEHQDVVQERYPDVLDLAAMDYSPARRKPPIHN